MNSSWNLLSLNNYPVWKSQKIWIEKIKINKNELNLIHLQKEHLFLINI